MNTLPCRAQFLRRTYTPGVAWGCYQLGFQPEKTPFISVLNIILVALVVDMSAWIMGSTGLAVAVSEDGKTFKDVATKDFPADTDPSKRSVDSYTIDFEPVKATFVKVIVKHSPALPEGHSGAGKSPYLFVDEIGVY